MKKNSGYIFGLIGTAVAVLGLGITILELHDARTAEAATMKAAIAENSRQLGLLWQRSGAGGSSTTRPWHP